MIDTGVKSDVEGLGSAGSLAVLSDASRWPLVWWEGCVSYPFSRPLPEKITVAEFGKSAVFLCVHGESTDWFDLRAWGEAGARVVVLTTLEGHDLQSGSPFHLFFS